MLYNSKELYIDYQKSASMNRKCQTLCRTMDVHASGSRFVNIMYQVLTEAFFCTILYLVEVKGETRNASEGPRLPWSYSIIVEKLPPPLTSPVTYLEYDLRHSNTILFSLEFSINIRHTDGKVTLLAGHLSDSGYANGIGSQVRFGNLTSFHQLNRETILLVDHSNHCIRRLDRSCNRVTDFAGLCGTQQRTNRENYFNTRFTFPYNLASNKKHPMQLFLTQLNNGLMKIDLEHEICKLVTFEFENHLKFIRNIDWYGPETLVMSGGQEVYHIQVDTSLDKVLKWKKISLRLDHPIHIDCIRYLGFLQYFVLIDKRESTIYIFHINDISRGTTVAPLTRLLTNIKGAQALLVDNTSSLLYIGHENGIATYALWDADSENPFLLTSSSTSSTTQHSRSTTSGNEFKGYLPEAGKTEWFILISVFLLFAIIWIAGLTWGFKKKITELSEQILVLTGNWHREQKHRPPLT